MESLSPALSKVINATGLRQRFLIGMAPMIWSEAVGEEIARRSRIDKVKNGVLFVVTENSVWSQELTYLKPKLIEKLNEKLGEPVVKDLRFSTGRQFQQKAQGLPSLRPRRSDLSRVTPPARDSETLQGIAAGIPDPELRKSFAAWGAKVLKIREWEKRHPVRKCETCGKQYRSRRIQCPFCAAQE